MNTVEALRLNLIFPLSCQCQAEPGRKGVSRYGVKYVLYERLAFTVGESRVEDLVVDKPARMHFDKQDSTVS